ncbi:MAG: glycosyltransferase family 39 protein [Candidatus Moduliflexus flocculans]|nr:glycosyltransferase family 39 protein [Candidatus Moduliflexus flocculans]
MPVFFPALLALMVKTFGAYEWAIRLPSVFAGLVAAFVLERIVRRGYGQPAGHIAGAFAALAPPLVLASRAATVEPTLALLGLGGIIFGLRAFEEDSPGEAPLSGILFGLGFLDEGLRRRPLHPPAPGRPPLPPAPLRARADEEDARPPRGVLRPDGGAAAPPRRAPASRGAGARTWRARSGARRRRCAS